MKKQRKWNKNSLKWWKFVTIQKRDSALGA